ncbi:MAG TPA: corrinoid protein [Actinomycetota bacterium]|nr:corrinoid protein [Actinomycetota bacterium]
MQREDLFAAMSRAIVDGDAEAAADLARRGLDEGVAPLEAIDRGFVPGIDHVGREFAAENMFLPELVLAGEAMKSAIAVLEPEMERTGSEREIHGTVVLAAAHGDIHDIGKSLVGTMLSASGFRVVDMGVDVEVDAVVEKVREVEADLVGISALLTTTMVGQRDVVEALTAAGIRDSVKVMVGGAPVTPEWASEIGADGFGEDAARAVSLARELVGT